MTMIQDLKEQKVQQFALLWGLLRGQLKYARNGRF